ncbi:MAG TPA: hypothetical protein VD794_03880 [Flavisolibacter sp.]|nr:hypothetical protein [Flavisolibacter sp.]
MSKEILKCEMCGIEDSSVKNIGFILCPPCTEKLGASMDEVEKYRNREEEFDGGGGA